ncbi:noncanonical pyrimidine nucleotidase, YjjG family [Aequorivita sp. H23M31]|uniref:Noncanonical pyrimidine nucleotidase, YjjG family n=1 Tax=Aequorivita ciconiae TaxID=2494375 RepID=A0A410G2Y0_9FLAO|nr:YjjG family noncanonical pyrimidine nucleotidase [Aequorivita sp. H23M31]QAA81585.1 noncanonical pyrimidine nucleotidase, YjjG family [Aequorivita sp. H23M31]
MQIEGITDVFFDLDHTLWDFDRNSALAFARVFQRHKIDLKVSEFILEYEPINLRYWKLFREEGITKQEMRRGRLRETFQIFKMDVPPASIDLLAESYIQELPFDNHLFSGTIEILDYLFSKYKLHIITNGFGEVQQMKLKNSRIEDYFNTVTTSEEVGVKKPNPIIFETAMKKASALPGHSIMIGDNYEADIEGALKVGMNSIFFNYNNESYQGTGPVINNLLQIKDFL